MAEDTSGTNVFLAFLLGAVLVAVGVVGFFMWDNYKATGPNPPTNITLNLKHR